MSIVFDLPLAYGPRIQSVPGVVRVATVNWFGGSLPAKKEGKAAEGDSSSTTDWSNFFPNLAVELEPYFAMYPEYQVPPDQYQALLAGPARLRDRPEARRQVRLEDRRHASTSRASSRPTASRDGPFEFVVRAIFDTDPVKYPGTDTNLMFFSRKYLYEATGRTLQAGTYYVEIDDPDKAGEVSTAIDAPLRELATPRPAPRRRRPSPPSFVAMAGNLALLLNGIGLAVTFTILARRREHHEHRRARAAHRDRRAQDARASRAGR